MPPAPIVLRPDVLTEHFMPDTIHGRTDQLGQLMVCLEPAFRKRKPLHVLLVGPSGTGKTLTAKAALAKVQERSVPTVYIKCFEANSLYAILDAIVRSLNILRAERIDTAFKIKAIEGHRRGRSIVVALDEVDRLTPKERNSVTVFAALDHCTAECVGIHAVKKATRFEALEPIRQGVKEHFGAFSAGSAAGLRLRHDHGSVYMSDDFQSEVQSLGMEPSPAFVRQPEGNGCIERFFRTLKEQLLWVRRFGDLDELRAALTDFRDRYNHHWILQRLNYHTPVQARRDFQLELEAAA